MDDIRISIIGLGVVGRSVLRLINQRGPQLRDLGINLGVVAVCDLWGTVVNQAGLHEDLRGESMDMNGTELVKEIDHDVVVEATPTNVETGEPGFSHISAALDAGKHVVTSNKGPLVLYYDELVSLAAKKGLKLRYEATVGAAMPVISLANDIKASNDILSVKGILNGTCNHILTRMMEDGLSYEIALSEAQESGFAESDPSYDVEGIDTACKLVILANSIFDMRVSLADIKVTGITGLTPEAVKLARGEGYVIKLIGEIQDELEVAPKLVRRDYPFASVNGNLNAICFQTDSAGEITVMGKGAGGMEAASAILSDLVAIASKGI